MYALLDAAVNSELTQALKWLQKALDIEADGVVGPQTKKALQSADNALEGRFLGHRLLFMANLKNWDSFSEGWAKRIAQILIER